MINTAEPQAPSRDHRPPVTADDRADGSARSHRLRQPVLVIMGISNSGKSTVAGLLGARLGWELQEGDDLHPATNIAKMAAGEPLTDEDRWPWLDRVAAWIALETPDRDENALVVDAGARPRRSPPTSSVSWTG